MSHKEEHNNKAMTYVSNEEANQRAKNYMRYLRTIGCSEERVQDFRDRANEEFAEYHRNMARICEIRKSIPVWKGAFVPALLDPEYEVNRYEYEMDRYKVEFAKDPESMTLREIFNEKKRQREEAEEK